MTNEQREGTRIIAEFMGGIAKNNNYGIQGYMFDDFNKPDFSYWVLVDTAKYHTSFDWLMPVWVKVKFIGADLGLVFKVYHNDFHVAVDNGDCPKAFEVVVKFLTWLKSKGID